MRVRTELSVSPEAVLNGAYRVRASLDTLNHHHFSVGFFSCASAEQTKVRPESTNSNAFVTN
jgi:hypothetical protein